MSRPLAVAYLRKSRINAQGGVSWTMQEEAVRDLANRDGVAELEVLSDWGVSGGSTKRRPAYRDLLARLDRGEIGTVYSFAMSRLSRSLADFATLLEAAARHDVRIRLVQEGDIDLSTAHGRGYAAMAGVFANLERELAAERNAAALEARRQRGDYIGRTPYGLTLEAGRLVPTADEPVEAVVAAYREAGSFVGTARLLNAQGVPSKSQSLRRRKGALAAEPRPWTHGTVADVLRRAATPELAVPLAMRRAGTKGLSTALFYRLLRCPCGHTMTPRRDPANATRVSGYYCAPGYADPHHPRPCHVAEPVILEYVKAEAARLRIPFDAVELREQASAEEAELRGRLARIADNYEAGLIDRAERDAKVAAVVARLDSLEAKTRAVDVPVIDWDAPPEAVNAILRTLWEHVQLDERMQPVSAEWLVPEWRQ